MKRHKEAQIKLATQPSEIPIPAEPTQYFIFAAAQVSVLTRNLSISCGCFGSESSQVSWITAMEVGLLALVCASSVAIRHKFSDKSYSLNETAWVKQS